MEKNTTDILQSDRCLRKMPYSVPDGYFRSLEDGIAGNIRRKKQQTGGLFSKLTPYFAAAAMFAIIATAGTFFLRAVTDDGDYTFEDYLVMSDGLTGMITYTRDDAQYAENAPDEQDIADYLIYTGVSTKAIDYHINNDMP